MTSNSAGRRLSWLYPMNCRESKEDSQQQFVLARRCSATPVTWKGQGSVADICKAEPRCGGETGWRVACLPIEPAVESRVHAFKHQEDPAGRRGRGWGPRCVARQPPSIHPGARLQLSARARGRSNSRACASGWERPCSRALPAIACSCGRVECQMVASRGVVLRHIRRVHCTGTRIIPLTAGNATPLRTSSGSTRTKVQQQLMDEHATSEHPTHNSCQQVGSLEVHNPKCTPRHGPAGCKPARTWEWVDEICVLWPPKSLALPVGGHNDLQRNR